MPRDYKNHKRSDPANQRSGLGFFTGLVLGLTVALGVFIYDRRVRIGPITDLKKLEDTRAKLRQADVEALVIRVGG